VAEGGMGAVWRARHIKLDVPVAVKLMSPMLAASAQARARFEREAKAAARLASPHVVEVHDYGVDADTPYIVMEFLEGEDLAARLESAGRLELQETAEIVEQVARALEVAHAAGVVHRDLKPGNVFLARTGREEIVKVLDFGIAKLHAEPGIVGTMPGTLMGSPSFMSPEQARGDRELDHRADLWSLGVLAFQCLTGHLPFAADDLGELILEICAGEVPAASGLWPGAGRDVDGFFARALALPIAQRFQSAGELSDALRAVVGMPVVTRSGLRTSAGLRARSSPASISSGAVTRRAPPAEETTASRSAAPSREAAEDALEVVAERFEIQAIAGEGGMGVVHRAKDRVTGAIVALKILRATSLDAERFFREARVLSEIRHPGVVKYVAHGVMPDGRLYLAMEWLQGGDLSRRLHAGPLGVGDSLAIVGRVAEAVGAAHRKGVVHGDLKPSNVLLAGVDLADAKVIDFGIARLVRRANDAPPRREQVLGTPGYMAPEQARGDGDMDARADVFALGCLLFECLAGSPPFAADTPMASIARAVLSPPPRVRDSRPEVPDEIDALLSGLLAKAREERPADGAAAAERIAAVSRALAYTPRSRESITTEERKLQPVVLVVPAWLLAGWSATALRSAREVRNQNTISASEAVTIEASPDVGPIARKFGARLEVLPGGAVAASWGSGLLQDQAAQAAACALALRDAQPTAAIAVATGRRGGSDDVLDRAAAAIARDEGTGSVAVDDVTLGLLEGRFEVERSGAGGVLRGELRADAEERRLLGKTTPCAGREPELGMLDALFRECVEEPAAKVVVLEGPAGAGKSRVRQELLRRIRTRGDEVRAWIGRGDVSRAGSPFAILSHALLSMLELTGGEPDDARRARLFARVQESVAAADARRVAAFLGDMIGIPAPDDPGPELSAAREDALLLGDQRRRAFEDFIAAETASGPVVLVLEDLHLADLPTVKLLDHALRALADRPFFVLATARPELDDLFPKIWEERVPQKIRVGPLSAKASERIVRHVLGAGAAPELVARIVGRAAGHALHLEEILRAVAERADSEFPETVLATVEARIGALDPAARRVLRAASVFGRTFWEGAVVALTPHRPGDVRDWLRDLAEREWITRSPAPRFAGEVEYTITQDLVQEAAYAMLPEQDRALGHSLAGEWLEGAGERDAIVLARHFELGGEPARAAGWLLLAAEQADAAGDFAAAVRHAERVLEIDPAPLRKGRARAVLAEAHLHRGELPAARARGLEAMELVPATEAAHFRACAAAVVASARLGDIGALRDVAARFIALGASPEIAPSAALAFTAAASQVVVQLVVAGERALGDRVYELLEAALRATPDPEPAARACFERAGGARAAFAGDLFGSITHLRAASDAFEAAGDLRSACSNRKTLGWYLAECGGLEEAERSLRESLALAARMGLSNLVAHAKHDLGTPLLRLGKLAEGRRLQEEALAVFQEQGDRRLETGAQAMLSAIAVADGRLADAERHALAAIASAPSTTARFTASARLADAHRAAGRHEEAVRVADEALALLGDAEPEECLVVCLLARAESLLALGRPDEAAATLARARAEIERRAEQIRDPELRASFLSRVPENARVMELAHRTWSALRADVPVT
jgi:serine/threonine protein kinase/tetratricopeptide (TPR) repeat protein